jgi:hypothetical protein
MDQGVAAMSAAKQIVEEVPHCIVSVVTGEVVLTSSPSCWAFGHGIRLANRLLFVAEEARRQVLISENATNRCSKAHHKFLPYYINGQEFFTLQSLGEGRLGVPVEPPFEPAPVVGMTPVVDEETNIVSYRPLTHSEMIKKLQSEAVVRGAATEKRLKEVYRTLDPGNVGWIGKQSVERWAQSSSCPYHLMPHDAKWIHEFLMQCCTLGEQRINFDEFYRLCLKLEQL